MASAAGSEGVSADTYSNSVEELWQGKTSGNDHTAAPQPAHVWALCGPPLGAVGRIAWALCVAAWRSTRSREADIVLTVISAMIEASPNAAEMSALETAIATDR